MEKNFFKKLYNFYNHVFCLWFTMFIFSVWVNVFVVVVYVCVVCVSHRISTYLFCQINVWQINDNTHSHTYIHYRRDTWDRLSVYFFQSIHVSFLSFCLYLLHHKELVIIKWAPSGLCLRILSFVVFFFIFSSYSKNKRSKKFIPFVSNNNRLHESNLIKTTKKKKKT